MRSFNWPALGLLAMAAGLSVLAAIMHNYAITPVDLGVAGMAGFAYGLLASVYLA